MARHLEGTRTPSGPSRLADVRSVKSRDDARSAHLGVTAAQGTETGDGPSSARGREKSVPSGARKRQRVETLRRWKEADEVI